MFWIWLIGCIIFGSIAAYFMGKTDPYEYEDAIFGIIVVIVLWPAVLALAMIIAPFAVPFILGVRAKNKREAAKKAEKLKNK
jgi:hypothetical protein